MKKKHFIGNTNPQIAGHEILEFFEESSIHLDSGSDSLVSAVQFNCNKHILMKDL